MDVIEFLLKTGVIFKMAILANIVFILFWIVFGIYLLHPEVFDNSINFFRKKIVYEKYTLGSTIVSGAERNLIKKNQNLLTDHGVPINKIKFVFKPQFTYDVDNKIINPVYQAFFPMDRDSGLFLKDQPVIEHGKPDNLITVVVGSYKTDDNYAYLKEILKGSKHGIAIMICDEIIPTVTGPEVYKFSVADETIRFANLDTAVEQCKNIVV